MIVVAYAKALASVPLCLAYWGGWTLAACVMGPLEDARKEACGAAGTRSPNERAGRWTPRPSIYRDGYVHG